MPTREALTSGVLDLVLTAGPVAKAILLILALFSIVSLGLMFEKWRQFRRVRRQTLAFLKVYRDARTQALVHASARKLRESPLAQLYMAAYNEMGGARDVVDQVLDDGDELSSARLERYLPFLATTASATPFIGLFGTVFGIIAAFHGIGQQGSASLAVVAPGISEALIATAAGLGAAIPAVIGYNYFINRVKHWATEMESFSLELLNLLARTAPKIPRVAKDGI